MTHSDDTTRRLRAIETVYKDYRFRSRLEARWAVFFDTLGVPWEYETEGFDLGAEGWYLPDLWLPRQNAWVEIRPGNAWGYDARCDALARLSGRRVVFAAGNPYPGEYRLCLYGVDAGGLTGSDPLVFALGRRDRRELWVYREDLGAWCLNAITNDDKWPEADCDELERAYSAARAARFGRSGRG